MFGIRFMKAAPTTYLLQYRNGRVIREGTGLSFFYYAPTDTLVAVPVSSTELPFVFTETTRDFQTVTVQGQLTYRVSDPRRLAALLDFSVDAGGNHRSEDPEALTERLVTTLQIMTRAQVQRRAIREVLAGVDAMGTEVFPSLRSAESIALLGIEVLAFSILSVRPAPEMAKALEAEVREDLQRRADQAIYQRRNAAVAEERKIKESELNTEIAVETKRREIRETQMAAEISIENRRTELIDRRTENERKDADARAYSLEATLKPIRGMDWKTLMAVTGSAADPKLMIALAFREMAENAQKIGEINVTPDLLKALLAPSGK